VKNNLGGFSYLKKYREELAVRIDVINFSLI
jgi:hypothetical protein